MARDDTADDAEKQAIADFYSRVATSYDRVGPAVFDRFGEGVVKVAGVHAGARVLDVGAGRGASLFPASGVVGVSGRVEGFHVATGCMGGCAFLYPSYPLDSRSVA